MKAKLRFLYPQLLGFVDAFRYRKTCKVIHTIFLTSNPYNSVISFFLFNFLYINSNPSKCQKSFLSSICVLNWKEMYRVTKMFVLNWFTPFPLKVKICSKKFLQIPRFVVIRHFYLFSLIDVIVPIGGQKKSTRPTSWGCQTKKGTQIILCSVYLAFPENGSISYLCTVIER